jgi:hypothetical protein
MRKSERKAVIAHHEAGHAVIARVLGLEVDSVTIIPDPVADTAGICFRDDAMWLALYADLATRLSAIEKNVVVSLAGPAAESQYLGKRETVATGGDLKMAKAHVQLALELSGRDHSEYHELFGQLSLETKILVSQYWSAIERVAHGLLDFSTLNGTDVDDLIAGTFLRTRTVPKVRTIV